MDPKLTSTTSSFRALQIGSLYEEGSLTGREGYPKGVLLTRHCLRRVLIRRGVNVVANRKKVTKDFNKRFLKKPDLIPLLRSYFSWHFVEEMMPQFKPKK